MNDLLRKNNGQPTNTIDISCVQTVGLKHAKGLFVLLETNFVTFEEKCVILDNVCPIVEIRSHFSSNVTKFVSNNTKSSFACFRPTVCTHLCRCY
jgi:hypothetical protein